MFGWTLAKYYYYYFTMLFYMFYSILILYIHNILCIIIKCLAYIKRLLKAVPTNLLYYYYLL
jgi:hypothetical protein